MASQGLRKSARVAGAACLVAGLLGIGWLALYLAQPALGFSDTDDPALGVRFVREHPQIFAGTGVTVIVMAIALTVAVVAVEDVLRASVGGWALRASTAFGLFAALCLVVFGVLRIGGSGPLLHIAGLNAAWGEVAYLVVQMAGVQGVLPAGLLTLALWAVGLSWAGFRVLPRAVCLLGLFPAVHVLSRLVGELGIIPESGWLLMIASIPGTLLWCAALGIGLLVRPPSPEGTIDGPVEARP